ncbi:hypothetical protein Tco_0941793 [Tanacetum coccineum]|uniref:Uncharacterized protein n=1 Tax=Tanacetum coccineum TaxID=301880 RepID=A0ABQ5DTH6_9ASTR
MTVGLCWEVNLGLLGVGFMGLGVVVFLEVVVVVISEEGMGLGFLLVVVGCCGLVWVLVVWGVVIEGVSVWGGVLVGEGGVWVGGGVSGWAIGLAGVPDGGLGGGGCGREEVDVVKGKGGGLLVGRGDWMGVGERGFVVVGRICVGDLRRWWDRELGRRWLSGSEVLRVGGRVIG